MSAAAGMAVMAAMFEAEITGVCAPKANTVRWVTAQSTRLAAEGPR
jgi:hypothetical protein